MVWKKFGLSLLVISLFIAMITGNFNVETVNNFIIGILNFGIDQSLPFEIMLLTLFGKLGVILIVIGILIDRLDIL